MNAPRPEPAKGTATRAQIGPSCPWSPSKLRMRTWTRARLLGSCVDSTRAKYTPYRGSAGPPRAWAGSKPVTTTSVSCCPQERALGLEFGDVASELVVAVASPHDIVGVVEPVRCPGHSDVGSNSNSRVPFGSTFQNHEPPSPLVEGTRCE